MDIKEIIKEVKQRLNSVGITDNCETEWLIAEALNIKRNQIYFLKNISNAEYQRIIDFLEKREKFMPLDYITGKSEFFGLKLNVNSNVLIPRPETELLVEEVLKVAKVGDNVLDIGTGSGAIAIAIKKNQDVNMFAVDISNKALAVAQQNAKENNADISFIQGDLFDSIGDKKFDIIISNPPYIPTRDIETLQNEVKDYEPHLALDGGVSGLDIYRRIINSLNNYLKRDGYVFFEIGIGQEKDIASMFDGYEVEVKKDYNGINRIIKARRVL